MSLEEKVLEALRSEPKGAAALAIAKKAGVALMEAVKALDDLVAKGLVEKKGKTYRLKR